MRKPLRKPTFFEKYERFFSLYYIFNFLTIGSYPACRYFVNSVNLLRLDTTGYTRESQVFGGLCIVLIVRFIKSVTYDHFISEVFLWSKLAIGYLYFVININYFLWYILL